jgi:hypothetical protein
MSEPDDVLEGESGAVMRRIPNNAETRAAMGCFSEEYDEEEFQSLKLYSKNGKGVYELLGKRTFFRRCEYTDPDEIMEFYRQQSPIVSYYRSSSRPASPPQ